MVLFLFYRPLRFRDGLAFLPYGLKLLPLFVLWVAAFMLLSKLINGGVAAGFFILMLLISIGTIFTFGALWFLMFPLLALAHAYAYWGVFGIHKVAYYQRNMPPG